MAEGAPLILKRKHTDRLDRALHEMLKKADARFALLVDQDGRRLACRGVVEGLDIDALCALIAGSFATTREMAKLLGESAFTVLFHQGEKDHIHNALVDDDTILSIVFDDRTTIGMVRLYSKEYGRDLADVMSEARNERGLEEEDEHVDGMDASERLDLVFGAEAAARVDRLDEGETDRE